MSTQNSHSRRIVPGVLPYPLANPVCARHGTCVTEAGQRKVFARNTYVTPDSQEKVLQYYSQQFGQPQQHGDTISWHQETHTDHQHVSMHLTLETTCEEHIPHLARRTLIQSYCSVISGKQANW